MADEVLLQANSDRIRYIWIEIEIYFFDVKLVFPIYYPEAVINRPSESCRQNQTASIKPSESIYTMVVAQSS